MSADKNDGGRAFPAQRDDGWGNNADNEGMALRDYFAAHAEIPWNAVIETLKLKGEQQATVARVIEYRAMMKYMEADAMLRRRGKQ